MTLNYNCLSLKIEFLAMKFDCVTLKIECVTMEFDFLTMKFVCMTLQCECLTFKNVDVTLKKINASKHCKLSSGQFVPAAINHKHSESRRISAASHSNT